MFTCWARSFFFWSTLIASTAEPWAMLDRAIMGHRLVPPYRFTSWESMALVMWCRPVITMGAYSRPKRAANSQRTLEVRPAYTTEAMASPICHPMGPTMVWATRTAGTREQKGTTIMLTTSGQIFLKNFSRYTSTKPASMAAMTWP